MSHHRRAETTPAEQRSPLATQLAASRRWWLWTGLIAPLLVAATACFIWSRSSAPDRLLQNARAAFHRGELQAAERLARKALARDPDHRSALELAIRSAIPRARFQAAAVYYERLPADDRARVCSSIFESAVRKLQRFRLTDAERSLRGVLHLEPQHVEATDRLAYLLRLTGRYHEAEPLHLELLRQGRFTIDILIALAHGEAIAPNAVTVQWLRQCHASSPDDPVPLAALARHALFENRTKEARELSERAIGLDEQFLAAHVLLGRALVEEDAAAELARWNRQLPPDAEREPGVWLVRGLWAQKVEDWSGAARCFGETLRRDPDLRAASYPLLQVLRQLGEDELAARTAEWTHALDELAARIKSFHADRERPQAAVRIAEWMESRGRGPEARAWHSVAVRPGAAASSMEPSSPEHSVPEDLVSATSRFPLPDWDDLVGPAPEERTKGRSDANIAFTDSADEAGLRFRYINSGNPARNILHMQETNGGGAAVLDYDADGRPDLYLAQGGTWPPSGDENPHVDRLFRNAAAGRFRDVTEQAGIRDTRFSQGVAAGDVDGDGFADLYVGNIGPNSLFRNNGDGTFSNVSEQAEPGVDAWTTSCLIADLDGDSLPDLYAVNYLSGEDVFTRVCRGRDGRPAACSPDAFNGAPDELFLNLGDGRFVSRSESAGIALASGKGLGALAADFDGSGRLNLFIANDQVPNFYFVNESQPGHLRFAEQAVVSGLAFDRDGNAQACMGIGADDCDGDGRCDLFVTNFYNESNTLYVQQPDGGFADRTAHAGLRDPSFALLGFGTQFLDADLDGRPDLLIANGHVTRAPGAPYQMRPQFLRNLGGRFEELQSATLGDYFRRERLGRSLATLDWNRDGRIDALATHLDAAVALLTNQTKSAGHRLIVRLAGVRSARDAIGTTVRVRAGENNWVRQLTAGDGFQASNQRQIVFGLGAFEQVDEVDIQWPSGRRDRFHDLAANGEYLAIEGRRWLVLLNRYPEPSALRTAPLPAR